MLKGNLTSMEFRSVQSLSCVRLCNCSMPGLPVHHQLPEFTQTHIHRVGDAIQPSHPLSFPSPPAPPVPPSIKVFSNESTLHMRWPKYWSFSLSTSNRTDLIRSHICSSILQNYQGSKQMSSRTGVLQLWAQ